MPAVRLDTAVTLADTATLPRASQVMMLEKVPLGQVATRIMPSASCGSIGSSTVSPQVAAGSSRNCTSMPIAGALGLRRMRVKSSARSSSDTPNIISAMIALRAIIAVGENSRLTLGIEPLLGLAGGGEVAAQLGDVRAHGGTVAVLVHVVGHARQLEIGVAAVHALAGALAHGVAQGPGRGAAVQLLADRQGDQFGLLGAAL